MTIEFIFNLLYLLGVIILLFKFFLCIKRSHPNLSKYYHLAKYLARQADKHRITSPSFVNSFHITLSVYLICVHNKRYYYIHFRCLPLTRPQSAIFNFIIMYLCFFLSSFTGPVYIYGLIV